MFESIRCYNLFVIKNCFVYTDYDVITGDYKCFTISTYINEFDDLIKHLYKTQKSLMVGFNSLNYHYPIIHNIITNREAYTNFSSDLLNNALYIKSQELMAERYNEIPNREVHIKQCDLFKLFHWDNPKKSCSIRKCQIALNFEDVTDCSITKQILRESDMEICKDFNKRSVDTIHEVFKHAAGKVDNELYKDINEVAIRLKMGEKYHMNLLSHSKVKMAEDVIVRSYAKREGLLWDEVKEMGTNRQYVALKDCIPSDISFKSKEFNDLLDKWSKKVIRPGEESEEYNIVYKGLSISTGFGGIHAAKPGIYKSDDKNVIYDIDGTSYYPTIVNARRIKPAHMKDTFFSIYDAFRLERIAQLSMPIEQQDQAIITGNKLIISSIFGKLNHENSPLYDPLAFMKITISGQLQILKLVEMLNEIPDVEVLIINTDGLACKVPNSQKDKYLEVKALWEKMFNIHLKQLKIDKFFMKDVSNYLSIDEFGNSHEKGVFRRSKLLNENNGGKIISICLYKYFVEGKQVIDSLKEHKNIYDFCLTVNTKSESVIIYKTINDKGFNEEIVGKTARYYVGGYSGTLVTQKNGSKTQKAVISGKSMVLFNKAFKSDNYKIDYAHYLKAIMDVIDKVEDKQMSLF